MVFSRPGPTFLQQPAAGAARAASSRVASSQEAGSRQPVVSSQDSASGGSQSSARTQHPGASLVYRAVSDDTLGSFWSLFPGHPSFSAMVFSRPGPAFLQQPASSQQCR